MEIKISLSLLIKLIFKGIPLLISLETIFDEGYLLKITLAISTKKKFKTAKTIRFIFCVIKKVVYLRLTFFPGKEPDIYYF